MKTLTIICGGCGKQKTFRGEDGAAIIKAIDAQNIAEYRGRVRDGWIDLPPDEGHTLSIGQMNGRCPDCD